MTLGKYVNANTFLHRLDPRNKFILLFVFMVLIFLINPSRNNFMVFGWTSYLLITVFLIDDVFFTNY